MEKVSVIIPTYNRADRLRRAIQSVRSQTFKDWKLVVVDDGSTDNTEEVVKNISDERITYGRHDSNRGGSAARNTGIRLSEGKYILMLDDDDLIKEGHLQLLTKKIEQLSEEWGVVYTGMEAKRGGKRKKRYTLWKGNITNKLMSKGSIGTTAVSLIRRKVVREVGMFDEDLPRHQDWDFYLRLSEITKFYPVKKATVVKNFTGHPSLEKTKKAKRLLEKKHSDKLKKLSVLEKREYKSHKYVNTGIKKLNEEKHLGGILDLIMATIIYPKNIKRSVGVMYRAFKNWIGIKSSTV